MTSAELAWVVAVVDDLQAGRITWSPEWLADIAARLEPTNERPIERRKRK
jgi:hypothetical protein